MTRALILITALAAATTAAAQERDLSDEEARSLFRAGVAAFDDARYDDALTYFQRAHQISGHPELLYNIGSAADRLRRDELALEAFRGFLDEAPDDHPERRAVNVRVAAILAAQAEGEPETPAEPEPVEEERPAPRPVGPLVGAGALSLGGATGVAIALAGIARGGECLARGEGSDCIERRETQWPAVATLGGLGVAALTSGVVWLVLALTKADRSAVAVNGSTLEVRF